MNDLRHALRSLRKNPGYTAVAVLTLALGIGVSISLFSMVSAFFLQPLSVAGADRLVIVMQRSAVIEVPYGHSYPDYLDYRAAARSLTELAAYMPAPAHIGARGQTPERTWIEVVSPNYFALAGVAPAFGDFPHADDTSTTTTPAVVLSYRYWQRRFGGNPSIVGQLITVNGRPFTVMGIAPASFTGLSWAMAVSAFVPAGALGALMDGGDAFRENRGTPAFRLMGRLAPGSTLEDARAEFEVLARQLATTYPAEHKDSRILLIAENRARPDPAISAFLPIFAAVFAAMVGLVLLIACANVANLTLARAVARQRDLVIRSALGATRFRLVRLQIVESVMLAATAGVLGLLLAQWAGQLLAGFAPSGDIPINQDRPFDWRIYPFALLVSAAAAVASGLWPARRATRFDLVESLKDGSAAAGTSRHTLRNLLVVGQVTLSLVVLVSAGLFLHSLQRMQTQALGFRPDNLLMMSIDLALQQYSSERGRQFLDDLLARAEALPGVRSATVMAHVPFDYGLEITDVGTGRDVPGAKDGYVPSAFNVVGPKFFETTGATLIQGRLLDARDDEGSRRVAAVNETMAHTLWPKADPLGQRFRFGRDGDWIEVVGVVADGKYVMLAEQPRPYFYIPLDQHYRSPMTLAVRTAGDAASLALPLQRLVNERDPDLPIFNVRTMDRHIRESVFALMPLRMGASMAGVQGLIGLLLAVMGLYAVVSYAVTRRTREIGVRMALGAARSDVMRLVVREGMRLSLVGLGIGLLLAFGVGFGLSRVLYGVAPVDIPVFASVTALLLIVSAVACYVPARRATRIDPLVALRYE
jgi:predicted permease